MTTPSPLSSLSPLPPASGPGPAAQQASARPGEAGQEPFDRALAREVGAPANASSSPASAPSSGSAPAPGNANAAPEKAAADGVSADQGEESLVAAGSADAAALAQFLAMAAQVVQTMPAARAPGKSQAAADSLLPAGEDGVAVDTRFAAAAAPGDGPDAAQPALQDLPEGAAPGALAASAPHSDSLAPGAADPSLPAFSALAPARAGQAHAAAPDALPQAPRLAPQVGAPGWDQALGQRVAWMAGNGQHSASLILNPPELGPLQVVLNVADSQATATFFSAQPEVRQALEAAMPRLRDMLDAAGIELGQASVSDGGRQQAGMGDGGSGSGRHGGTGGGAGMEAVPGGNTVATRVREGLVNTFA